MTAEPLDELYFVWLYRQVASPDITEPSLTYWKLLKELFTKEFVWLIPNDDNRLEDGKELRAEFLREESIHDVDRGWIELGCSVLELMIGLSRRLAFEAEGEPHYWFWHMIDNLGIGYSDSERFPKTTIRNKIDKLIFRTYGKDGRGGLFPLNHPSKDQRKVELWYQLSAYVLEQS